MAHMKNVLSQSQLQSLNDKTRRGGTMEGGTGKNGKCVRQTGYTRGKRNADGDNDNDDATNLLNSPTDAHK